MPLDRNFIEEFRGFIFSAPTMATIGNIGSFDSNEETWATYVERFELFCECNNIDDSKKVSTFLTLVGVKTYNLLKDLVTPDKPANKTYKVIIETIEKHLHPKPSFITERYKFSRRDQQQYESISEYIVQLKQLSKYCDFGDKLPDYLRDRLVSGISDNGIKKRLLGEEELTFDKAVQLATSMEVAEKDAASLAYRHNGHHGSNRVQALQSLTTRQRQSPSNKVYSAVSSERQASPAQCYCCGKSGHYTKVCRFREYVCNFCKKKGHLEKACQSKSRGKYTQYSSSSKNHGEKQKQTGKNKFKQHFVDIPKDEVNSNCNDEVYDISNIFTCSNENVNHVDSVFKHKIEPITINLMLEGKCVQFEIDSGACVSVVSNKFYQENLSHVHLQQTNLILSSYTHEKIVPTGKLEVNVDHQNETKKLDLYVISNGSNPLLGRDWIKELQIVVSIPNSNNVSQINKTDKISEVNDSNVTFLFSEFPNVFTDKLGCFTGEVVELKLKENAIPKYHKPRAIPYALRDKVEQELKRLENDGIISSVKSSLWGTPIVPVLKRNGQIRICGDFKVTLNPYLEVDRHPIPRIEDLFTVLQKGEKFSKIDLSQAYQQLMLSHESRQYCTISTHKGLFSYNRLCYGISSAPGIFQRIIEQTLQGITGVASFLDDVIITGRNTQEHLSRLRQVCERLNEKGLTVSKNKCEFFKDKLEYLGFVITKEGLSTAPDKIKAIVEAPVPKDVTQLKGFLGLVNYYSKFVPSIASILTPMYSLLKKNVEFKWNKACMLAFQAIKNKLVSSEVLAHYDPKLSVKLACDASAYGIAAVISQIQSDGSERPISFASRVLNSAEKAYSQIDKEALSIVFGVKKFNQYLYGRPFTLCTDHKPLLSIFGEKKGLPTFAAGRLQRYALFLSGYEYNICYVKSHCHGNADGLSRLPLPVEFINDNDLNVNYVGTYLKCIQDNDIPIDFKQVIVETQKDAELKKVFGYIKYGWPHDVDSNFKPYVQRQSELTIEQGIIMWGYRVVMPQSLRGAMLKELHSGHLGIVKMKSLARSYLWWPSIDKDVESTAQGCSACLAQRENPNRSQLHVWEYPSRVWQRIHIDFLGPFKGKLYLVVLDAYSKWLEVETVSSTSAKQTIEQLRVMFARFGLPELIVSDNGPPFSSDEFRMFLKHNGVRQTLIAPYHPSTNGQAENAVKLVKKRLKCALFESQDINLALSRFLLMYRNAIHSTTSESPAKLMFNRSLRTKLDLIRPSIQNTVFDKQSKQVRYAGGSKPRVLCEGQPVLTRDYRGRDKWVAGKIVKKLGPVTYLVQLETGLTWKRHIDQLVGLNTEPELSEGYTRGEIIIEPIPSRTADRPVTSPTTPPSTTTMTTSAHSTPRSILPRHSTTPRTTHVSLSPRPQSPLQTPLMTTVEQRRYPIRTRKPVTKLDL